MRGPSTPRIQPRIHARRLHIALNAIGALALLGSAACAGGPRASAPASANPSSVPPAARGTVVDTTLEGAFRWVAVDDRPAPADFPPGSGHTLMAGTLELRRTEEAAAGGGRFGLRFTLRPASTDTTRVTGEDGRFRLAGDSLHFTPDGREDRPPVRFRYAWRPDGLLALTDTQGHVWVYVRQ